MRPAVDIPGGSVCVAARSSGRAPGDCPVSFEALEARLLLSQTPVATPGVRLYYPVGSSQPAVSASPIGLSPTQITHAYGIDVTKFGDVPGDGTGQTIAIVDAYNDPNIVGDVGQFCSQFSLPACNLVLIGQDGSSTLPTTQAPKNGTWGLETALDVEWAHAIAPYAKIVLVEANSNANANLYAAVSAAANYPGVSVVSMSWGAAESSNESSYDQYFMTSGVTFVASSGDTGIVEYPAVSPNVLAVGGTTITPALDSSGDYTSESGWSGSGGGISQYISQPAYQNGVVTQ